ncbi:MAG TPA: methyl-accepting chemotaxis protein [Anaeromyxobacter sp.]|nr:methyl-accepting chemotaxis protein [Anaeromyxobacter sp.]
MRHLHALVRKAAIAEAIVFLFGVLMIHGAVALEPGQGRAIALGAFGCWVLVTASLYVGLRLFGGPFARALDAPAGPIDLGLARAAVANAVRLPDLVARLVLVVGSAGTALTVLYAFVGLRLAPDVAVAAFALGFGMALLGAMVGYSVLAAGLPALIGRLELATDDRPPGSMRAKIVTLGVGMNAIAVLLVASVAYLQHRDAVVQETARATVQLADAALSRPGLRAPAEVALVLARDTGGKVALVTEEGKVLALAGGLSARAPGKPAPEGVSMTVQGFVVTRPFAAGFAEIHLQEEDILTRLPPFWQSLLLAAIVAFLGAGLLAWLAAVAITLPFRELGTAADRIAEGDLTASPPSVSGDEVGRLAAQFRRMAQGLTGLVREVQTASENVSAGAIEAGAIGERVRRGALEQHEGVRSVQSAVQAMESSVAQVARGVGGLADYVSATSRAMGEMAQTFEEVQRKAGELERGMTGALAEVESLGSAGRDAEARLTALENLAARSGGTLHEVKASVTGLERAATESEATASAVAEAAERAGVVMEGTVHGIETLRGAVADAHSRIAALGRRSDDIDQVVDFISEVAGRTNLLSLNASIIASQAGEHGKAFAVVADQIRELAAQIARSTKSIGDIIHAVREDVEGTASLIDRGDALAVEGVQLARNSVEALSEIRRSTAHGRETAAAIRTAVQAHAASTREVANLVEMVAEGSRAVASAVQLVGRSVGGVHSVSRGVTGMADRVARTLEDQAGLGRRQLENVARLENMIQEITQAVEAHNAATQGLKKALEALSHTAGEHESAVHGLSGVADQIGSRARALSERVNRFKV